MKAFKEYLLEATKDRFIDKNRNLTDDQKEEIKKFFSVNRQAESQVDWNKSKRMKYDDFLDIMIKFKSGRKTKLKHKNISGLKHGEDYINIKMRTKEFLAYAVMNYEGSKMLASDRVGPCRGQWCTAHSESPQHWQEYAVENKDVFVYVMNTSEKWAVQIDEDNRSYEVWDKDDRPIKEIPGFNIKQELLTPKLKKMYDDIRDNYEDEEMLPPENFDDAVDEYRQLVRDIEDANSQYETARDEFYHNVEAIKSATYEHYSNKMDKAEAMVNEYEEQIEEYESEIDDLETDIEYPDDDEDIGDKKVLLLVKQRELEELKKKLQEAEDAYSQLDSDRDTVENTEQYEFEEMSFDDSLEWQGDLPEGEFSWENDVEWVDPFSYNYSTYMEYAQDHMGAYFNSKGEQELRGDIQMYIYEGGYRESAGDVLSKHELYEPYWENY